MSVIVGTRTDAHSFRSQVGMGSESDCLFGQLERILWISDSLWISDTLWGPRLPPLPKKGEGAQHPLHFWLMSIVVKRLGGLGCYLTQR